NRVAADRSEERPDREVAEPGVDVLALPGAVLWTPLDRPDRSVYPVRLDHAHGAPGEHGNGRWRHEALREAAPRDLDGVSAAAGVDPRKHEHRPVRCPQPTREGDDRVPTLEHQSRPTQLRPARGACDANLPPSGSRPADDVQ